MKYSFWLIILFAAFSSSTQGQEVFDTLVIESSIDPILLKQLDEIIIIANATSLHDEQSKSLGSVDDYLEKSSSINMIRRGVYAWEPMLNGMATERSVVTIDGMRVYAACTDKMDPVTSYIENSNLSSANVHDGQAGAMHGGTIAGSIDLTRRRAGFDTSQKFKSSVFTGYESNNHQKIIGTSVNFSEKRFFTNFDLSYRDAENYKAGKRKNEASTVDYSQYRKFNTSAIMGYKPAENHEIEISGIYDRATDIGYPGLAMDVSLAEAVISSVQYRYRNIGPSIHLWETKLYFNDITHIMDDTKRPDVPIRMDMPGWSRTYGLYSKIYAHHGIHALRMSVSGHHNNLLAEMTMFPNDPNEIDMFMLTWPDVNTIFGNISVEDDMSLTERLKIKLSAGIAVHHNEILNDGGFKNLQLFFPEMDRSKTRLLLNINAQLSYSSNDFTQRISVGYGDRAPSVSESYGFYLYNTDDNYDYVGNPMMKNESALDISYSTVYSSTHFMAEWKTSLYYMQNYIIGLEKEGYSPMNILADGVKVYEQLPYATIFNTSLDLSYHFGHNWISELHSSYRYGSGKNFHRLPLIQPLYFRGKLKYALDTFFAEVEMEGSSKNRNSYQYGESQKPAYFILNCALSKEFSLGNTQLIVKGGIENVLDKYYVTFDSWMHIPRMGRNFFINAIIRI